MFESGKPKNEERRREIQFNKPSLLKRIICEMVDAGTHHQ